MWTRGSTGSNHRPSDQQSKIPDISKTVGSTVDRYTTFFLQELHRTFCTSKLRHKHHELHLPPTLENSSPDRDPTTIIVWFVFTSKSDPAYYPPALQHTNSMSRVIIGNLYLIHGMAFRYVKYMKNMSDLAAVDDKLASLQHARAGLTTEA